MRKDLLEDIDRIVKQAGLEGTLTEDAIGYYNSLIKITEETKAKNAELEKQLKECDEQRRAEANKHHEASQKLNAWIERERELVEREKEITKLELKAEYEAKRVDDHKTMFATVFKGYHVRKQVVTPGSSHKDQYGNRTSEYPDVTDTEEEEK